MKAKSLLVALSILLVSNTISAKTGYDFYYGINAYADLPSPVVIVNNSGFDGTVYSIPIGFNFHYWGTSYSTFYVSTDAYFSFAVADYGFYPFYSALKGIGYSSISYMMDNVRDIGNRILKVQFKNVGFEMNATNTDSVSFQIWLYELTGNIEYHYGVSNIARADYADIFGNSFGPQVALAEPSLATYYNLRGDASNPTLVTIPMMYTYLTGYPMANTTYTFIPVGTAVPYENKNTELLLYPNPANGKVNLSLKGYNPSPSAKVTLINMIGETVFVAPFTQNTILDVSGLYGGIYTLTIVDNDNVIQQKVAVTH
ncbi:MAG: T9SS type A sorting domain-containing protein [Taibaiella sp.]|nr:T9SS type A sorting domain-containing protein [Taibaiella sp.]